MTIASVFNPNGQTLHLPSDEGLMLVGPGDWYRLLVTSQQTGGMYAAMEAIVPPGGGPPPHIHRREDETFYVLEGQCDFILGDERITAGVGDFVNVPRDSVHCFHNASDAITRLLITFTPGGLENFFFDTLERATSMDQTPPDNLDEVVARYLEAAPKYGLEFV
jgi:quercetin dioxygenase-like cupin family protein